MAGHSKWKNIQHRKGRQDAIKGKMFNKLSREIYVAARQGDIDPDNNQKLRLAINKAKQQNMPNENIERAIQKAGGSGDGRNYEEVTYEGYGPHGTAFMVETLTDNRNRTASDMRYVLSKNGGNLGEAGCVSWMFQRRGLVILDKESDREEELMLLSLDNGALDVEIEEKEYVVICAPDCFEHLKAELEAASFSLNESMITFVSSNKVDVNEEDAKTVISLIEAIEEYDDVQNVYTNLA